MVCGRSSYEPLYYTATIVEQTLVCLLMDGKERRELGEHYYFPSINQDGSDFTVNGFLVGEVRLVYLVECLLSLCMVKVD